MIEADTPFPVNFLQTLPLLPLRLRRPVAITDNRWLYVPIALNVYFGSCGLLADLTAVYSVRRQILCDVSGGTFRQSSTTAADLDMMKKLHDAKEKAEFDRWKLERSIMTILDKMMEGK